MTVDVEPATGGAVEVYTEIPDTFPFSTSFRVDAEVQVTAIAARGYEFVSWQGDATGSETTITLIMTCPKKVTAVFVKAKTNPLMPLLTGLGIVLILWGSFTLFIRLHNR